jgi:virginiamycin B lyase
MTPGGSFTELALPGGVEYVDSIAIGPDGNPWVACEPGGVLRVNPDDTITTFPIPGGGGAWSITTGPDDHLWFSVGNEAGGIGRIATDGQMTIFTPPAASNGIHAVTSGPDGTVWFAESWSWSIGHIRPDGTAIREFALRSPAGDLTAGPDGNIWYTEAQRDSIGRITPTGAITLFPIPQATYSPSSITAGPDGNIWFTAMGGVVGTVIVP